MCGTDFLTPNPEFSTRWPHPDLQSRVSEKCSAVGTGYPRARRALHVEQRCSTLAPVGRLGRRKLAASLARRATIFDRISKDFAPPKPQSFLRTAPYGRGRPTAGALRARRPTARYPRSDPTSETRAQALRVGCLGRDAPLGIVLASVCRCPASASVWEGPGSGGAFVGVSTGVLPLLTLPPGCKSRGRRRQLGRRWLQEKMR